VDGKRLEGCKATGATQAWGLGLLLLPGLFALLLSGGCNITPINLPITPDAATSTGVNSDRGSNYKTTEAGQPAESDAGTQQDSGSIAGCSDGPNGCSDAHGPPRELGAGDGQAESGALDGWSKKDGKGEGPLKLLDAKPGDGPESKE
jgi:hypothetical protein